jgi:hypothetical protein
MSSSYLSLKRLEISYEAYVETFRDHRNEEEMRYKLCGADFVFDLCGLLDRLWPIVILMLKAQLQWCPGWKFPAYMKAAHRPNRAIFFRGSEAEPKQES